MKKFLSARPLPAFESVYALLRMAIGLLMVLHGWEVFDSALIENYAKWLNDLHFPAPALLAWLGKATELLTGLGILLGFATRLMAIPLIITMLVIAFGMGEGKIWYGDQHPFMFVLFGVLFFFGGSGKWSLDSRFFD